MKHRLVTAFFGLCLVLILIFLEVSNHTIGLLLLLTLLYTSVLTAGVFIIKWNYFITSINRSHEGTIIFTFDDSPCPEDKAILTLLKKENIRAGFFVIGEECIRHADILKQIVANGHTIGNHSYSHENKIGWLTTKKVRTEIERCNTAIRDLTGVSNKYYRPPFGIVNPNIARAIKKEKMTSVGWSIRTYDTTAKKENKLIQNTLKQIDKRGSIILFHSHGKYTLNLLQEVIKYSRANGIKIANFDELHSKSI